MSKVVAPYGSWISPVTAQSYAGRSVLLTQLRIDGTDIYWVEGSPRKEGRKVLLRRNALGQTSEALPLLEGSRLVHAESRVHELGGRAYAVKDGFLVVSDGSDDRVYRFDSNDHNSQLLPLTQLGKRRYGDFEIDRARGVVYAVEEDHTDPEDVTHHLVSIPLDGSGVRSPELIRPICDATDYVSSPSLSPDGSKLAWVTWDNPDLPWTYSQLRVAALDEEGRPGIQTIVVDRDKVSVTEPRWTMDGDLVHIDDSTGWKNLYKTEGFQVQEGEPEDAWISRLRTRVLHPARRSFSAPRWHLGMHTYDNLDHEHLICSWSEGSTWHLGTVQLSNGMLEEWDVGWWPIGNVAAGIRDVVLVADSGTHYPSIVKISKKGVASVRDSNEAEIDQDLNSPAQPISWPTRDGQKSHGFYYAPNNPEFEGPPGELPPLITMVHSGPANSALPGLSLARQYWTTRGFAVLDVNYRGSTGLDRGYLDALEGQFGSLDVADTVDGVEWLAAKGLIDPDRVAISGNSTGGFTVLSALTTTDIFSAGTSRYGLGNLADATKTASPIDAVYIKRLVGSQDLSDPIWEKRNPENHLADISAPLLLQQGADDTIMPPSETERIYEKLVDLGKEAAYILFENEGHGFVRADTLEMAWRSELAFYADVWGIKLQHPVPVDIANRADRPVANPIE